MSSRILPREGPSEAPRFLWRAVRPGAEIIRGTSDSTQVRSVEEGASEESVAAAGAAAASLAVPLGSHIGNAPQGHWPDGGMGGRQTAGQLAGNDQQAPSGPTWEQYRELEVRLREAEQQIPQREQQARLAAQKQAESAATAHWEAALEKLSRAVADITSLRARLRREAEQDVVKLSLAIARRVLHREVTMDRDALLGVIRTAFEKLDVREIHRVRLRPEDTAIVRNYLDRLGMPNRVEVQADASLERGGAVVETQRGSLDVSLDTQLAEIERGFTDLLEKRTSA